MEPDVLERILGGSEKPTNLPFALLNNITGNFSEEQEIGEGGFAIVYKGVLPNGNVAVKRIMNSHTIDEKLFYREVDSFLTVNHPNVVRFLGFCASTEQTAIQIEGSRQHIYAEIRERLLCFEYISNGSLQKHITDELRGLKWSTRYRLIKGICEGLLYLHKEKHIYHMDLKPSNILLDNDMVPKITDFGLSRLDEKSQTMSQFRCGSLGYCAPEYLHRGKMSFKSDMYSLGTIIIELVTGDTSIPNNNKNNVLRRWRHRWKKTGKENPLAYQQVVRCIDIGLLCQEIDPCKRPFIWDIIRDINEVEDINGQISTDDESTVGQIIPYSEDDMLGIEPLELHFPFEPNKQLSCSLQLTNDTNAYIAFNIQTTSPLPYCMQPIKDIMPPRSNCSVDITLQPLDKVPRHADELIVRSTKVDDGLTAEHITTAMFSKDTSNVVDEVIVDAFFEDTVTELVLGIRSHCMGCVERIERRIKRMPGSSACLEQASQQDNVTSSPERTPMASGQPALQTFVLRVYIHCHGCKKKVRKVLKSIEGVYDVKVDAQLHKVMVTGTVDAETLLKRLYKSGKQALPWQHTTAKNPEAPAPAPPAEDGSKDAAAADKKPAEPVKEPQAYSSDKKHEQETASENKPETEKKADKEEAKPSDHAKKDGGEGAATEPKVKGTKEAGNDEGEADKKQSKPKDAPAAIRSLSTAPARRIGPYLRHPPPQQGQPMQQWSPSYLYMPYPHASPESYYQDYYSPLGTHASPPPPPPLQDSYRLFDDENPNSCSVM